MTKSNVTVDQWVELFRAIGLTDDDMDRWHQKFESGYPEGHQGFLEWLQLPPERIAKIRRASAKD